MSNIVNYKTGRTVDRTDYVDDGFIDVYERNLVEKGLLPCIYYGFNVTAGSGLTVTVSPGAARGQDLPFIINGATGSPLPTIVNDITTATTINIPANSTGWIVLNVNVWDAKTNTVGYTSNGDLYEISATTNANIPSGGNVGPMFVTSLQNGTNTVWPFTQILLAEVISNGANITSIKQNFQPTSPQRSFDFQASLLSVAQGSIGTLAYQNADGVNVPVTFNNGAYININPSDTAPTRVASQSYANGGVFKNSNGTCYTLPGGLKIQLMPVLFPNSGSTRAITNVVFPIPFTDLDFYINYLSVGEANSGYGDNGIPAIDNNGKNLTNCNLSLDTNGQRNIDHQIPATVIAIGI